MALVVIMAGFCHAMRRKSMHGANLPALCVAIKSQSNAAFSARLKWQLCGNESHLPANDLQN